MCPREPCIVPNVCPVLDALPMPDLIRTAHGWTVPDPGPCPCGEARAMVGWTFCRCPGAEDSGGHHNYRCRGCDAVRVPGCEGATPMPGPMEEYGCR